MATLVACGVALAGVIALAVGARKEHLRVAASEAAWLTKQERVEPYPVTLEALPTFTVDQCTRLAWMPVGEGFILVATGVDNDHG